MCAARKEKVVLSFSHFLKFSKKQKAKKMNKKMVVLVVEDNEDNSLLAEKILKHYGFETFIAINGTEALRYCETKLPDLILMDLSLPDIDGMEVARRLRKKAEFQTIPIIALTAHAMWNIQENTEDAGLNDFLTKPFLPNDLIGIVKKHLKPGQ